jgi:hypothetical protein
MDSRPGSAFKILNYIRSYFFSGEWYQVYDFIEFVIGCFGNEILVQDLNAILERELAGFRVIENVVVPITDKAETEALEEALVGGPYEGSKTHLS